MKTMKSITVLFTRRIPLTKMAALLTVPVLLMLTGCKEKGTAPADAGTAVGRDSASTAPDNSGKNVRDRNDQTLTPGDQGGSEADREITQKVRKSLVSGTNDYSVTAKNIKIITTGGKVTLRGPVKSAEEKAGIAAIAKTVAGEGNVEDQLEVK